MMDATRISRGGETQDIRVVSWNMEIGIHAHYNNEQYRIAQAKWLNEKIKSLLDDPKETHNIICRGYN